MALIGETVIDGIKIRCRIDGPQRHAAIPTLRFSFTIDNDRPKGITIMPFIYEVDLDQPRPIIHLGTSVAFFTQHGVTEFTNIPSRGSRNFSSNFELGYNKLGVIMERVKKDIFLRVKIFGSLFDKLGAIPGVAGGRADALKPISFGAEISSIKIPASEWTDWLSIWVKELRTITISGELGRKLDELKNRMKIVSDEELITELYESYPRPKKEKQ